MKAFPLAVRLTGAPCLCVGGGAVAARRVPRLVEAGATVMLVTPSLDPTLRPLVEGGQCAHLARPFASGDCSGMFLVHVATGDPEVDERAAAEARALGALVCVASNPALGNCQFMATLRRGPLVVALHTDGAAPAVTAALCRRIDAQLPERLGDILDSLAEIRGELRRGLGDPAERARRWTTVVECGALDRLLSLSDTTNLDEIRSILAGRGPSGLRSTDPTAPAAQSAATS